MQSDTLTKEMSNGEKIAKLNELYAEIDLLKETASDAIKLAKANKENEIEITRKDGKVSTVKEQLLWDEVRIVGDATEAYELLKGKYPTAFSTSEEVSKKALEIDNFALAYFGVHADRITLRDIINLIVMFTNGKS
jgi:urocanate hydratase